MNEEEIPAQPCSRTNTSEPCPNQRRTVGREKGCPYSESVEPIGTFTAASLERAPVKLPPRFFKFVSSSTAMLVLKTGTRRWSSPLKWDDQEEFRRFPRFEPSLREALRLLPQALIDIALRRVECEESRLSPSARWLVGASRALREHGIGEEGILNLWKQNLGDPDGKWESVLRGVFNTTDLQTTRVFCVTDNLGNKNLWENYADRGRGCALEFRHVPPLDTPLVMAQPVRYSVDGPRVEGALRFLLFRESRELKQAILDEVCLSKGMEYEPEREWRVVTWAPEEVGKLHADYAFHPAELASITIGPRFDLAQFPQLRAILRGRYPATELNRMPASLEASMCLNLPVEAIVG